MHVLRSRASRWTAAAGLAGVMVCTGLAVPTAHAAGAPNRAARNIAYTDWSTNAELNRGTHQGTRAQSGALRLAKPVGTRTYKDPHSSRPARRYELARWLSPRTRSGFGLTEAIASWTARTPGASWVQVEMRTTTVKGKRSKWYVMGRWAGGDGAFHRTSAGSQADALGRVSVDAFQAAAGRRMRDWQLRVTLLRPVGGSAVPQLLSVGAVASQPPPGSAAASPRFLKKRRVIGVPTYSQQRHAGRYQQWGGGGEAWCSPTSTSMVLRHWGRGPKPRDYAWVKPTVDPWVVHAARGTFDYAYDGAGNWPFNTAYAGRYNMNAFVTRLRSLNEAERFIAAGIPLVVSMSFSKGELDGAGYGTNGHLMVIVGFDAKGNVVVNDPASHLKPRNDQVRFTYDRTQFENAWVPKSGGLTYVMHPPARKLPPAPRQSNW